MNKTLRNRAKLLKINTTNLKPSTLKLSQLIENSKR